MEPVDVKTLIGRCLLRFRAVDGPTRRADYSTASDRDDQLIRQNLLHFARAASFNDPFEARPFFSWSRDGRPSPADLHRLWEEQRDSLNGMDERVFIDRAARFYDAPLNREEYKRRLLAQQRNEFRATPMACFSHGSALEEILLWAHYAESCSGYAACFDFTQTWIDEIDWRGSRERVALRATPVTYSLSYPVIDGDSDFHDPSRYEHITRLALLTKSKAWAYEKEHRVLLVAQQPGLRRFPAPMLAAIFLGPMIEADDERKLRELAAASPSKPHVIKLGIHDSEYRFFINVA